MTYNELPSELKIKICNYLEEDVVKLHDTCKDIKTSLNLYKGKILLLYPVISHCIWDSTPTLIILVGNIQIDNFINIIKKINITTNMYNIIEVDYNLALFKKLLDIKFISKIDFIKQKIIPWTYSVVDFDFNFQNDHKVVMDNIDIKWPYSCKLINFLNIKIISGDMQYAINKNIFSNYLMNDKLYRFPLQLRKKTNINWNQRLYTDLVDLANNCDTLPGLSGAHGLTGPISHDEIELVYMK